MLFLRIIWLPGSVLLATLFWIWLDLRMGWHGLQMRGTGIALISAGALLASWCAVLLSVRGRGSPHPFVVKTKRMVTDGPYGVVRNPMMWGVALILAGICLFLGSVALWAGFACFWLFLYWFVRTYEERDMEDRFGDEYRDYCRHVPRWFPRWINSHAPFRHMESHR